MEELIPIAMFLSIAAVAILRPVTSKLGHLLEAIAKERSAAIRPPSEDGESAQLRVLLEHIGRRMDLLEERLDFTERLLASSGRAEPASLRSLRADPYRRELDRPAG